MTHEWGPVDYMWGVVLMGMLIMFIARAISGIVSGEDGE